MKKEDFFKHVNDWIERSPSFIFQDEFLKQMQEVADYYAKQEQAMKKDAYANAMSELRGAAFFTPMPYSYYMKGIKPFDSAVDICIQLGIKRMQQAIEWKQNIQFKRADIFQTSEYMKGDTRYRNLMNKFDDLERKYLHLSTSQVKFNQLKSLGIVVHDTQSLDNVIEQHGLHKYFIGYDPFETIDK